MAAGCGGRPRPNGGIPGRSSGNRVVSCAQPVPLLAAAAQVRGPLINLASAEYSKTVLPHVDAQRVVTPRILTIDPASKQPKFVVVHAKIARGGFARWLVSSRVTGTTEAIRQFRDLGYRYDGTLSTPSEPTLRMSGVRRQRSLRPPHPTAALMR